MKLVTAIIKPFKLDDVKAALETLRRQGMTVSEVQRLRPAEAATPRSTGARSTPWTWCPRSGSRSWSTTRTPTRSSTPIVEAARTGKIGDGKVWVDPGRDGRAGAHRRARSRRALTGTERPRHVAPSAARRTGRRRGAPAA